MKSKIHAMLELQDIFNKKVHPEWIEQGYAWDQAILCEAGELLEHTGYKWWKQQTPDINQMVMELVDIWHFGMSLDMALYADMDTNDCTALVAGYEADIKYAVETFSSEPDFDPMQFKCAVTILVNGVTSIEPMFDTEIFFLMWHSLGLTFDDLYKRYIGKNALNEFRQLNGYKSGTYIKIWNNREDNEYLTDILESLQLDENLYSNVLNQLTVEYSKL
jgi:hypothetical protein